MQCGIMLTSGKNADTECKNAVVITRCRKHEKPINKEEIKAIMTYRSPSATDGEKDAGIDGITNIVRYCEGLEEGCYDLRLLKDVAMVKDALQAQMLQVGTLRENLTKLVYGLCVLGQDVLAKKYMRMAKEDWLKEDEHDPALYAGFVEKVKEEIAGMKKIGKSKRVKYILLNMMAYNGIVKPIWIKGAMFKEAMGEWNGTYVDMDANKIVWKTDGETECEYELTPEVRREFEKIRDGGSKYCFPSVQKPEKSAPDSYVTGVIRPIREGGYKCTVTKLASSLSSSSNV